MGPDQIQGAPRKHPPEVGLLCNCVPFEHPFSGNSGNRFGCHYSAYDIGASTCYLFRAPPLVQDGGSGSAVREAVSDEMIFMQQRSLSQLNRHNVVGMGRDGTVDHQKAAVFYFWMFVVFAGATVLILRVFQGAEDHER